MPLFNSGLKYSATLAITSKCNFISIPVVDTKYKIIRYLAYNNLTHVLAGTGQCKKNPVLSDSYEQAFVFEEKFIY